MGIFIPVFLIVLCSYLLWKSCNNFDRFSKIIGNKLTHGVRGATINAIGSSLPEFFTAFFFLIILRDVEGFSSGLATILGSAIFNILLIPAVVILILIKNKHQLMINKKLIIRDAGILLVSQIFLLYSIQDGIISLLDSFVLFLIYLAYLLVLSRGGLFVKDEKQAIHKKTIKGAWSKIWLSVFKISLWCLLLVTACEILFTGEYPSFFSILNFSATDSFGFENMMYIALIFAAAASSVPDMIISAFDAKSGDADDSLANPLASNLFDICIAFGIPLFIYTLINGEIQFKNSIDISTFQDIHSLTILMIIITILFLISILTFKKYKIFHVVLFFALFLAFVYTAFNLEVIHQLTPWM
tara:strand:- start:2728 stop:3798 length:1071 start_codon:yes stop_codon:yes gene_type:complete